MLRDKAEQNKVPALESLLLQADAGNKDESQYVMCQVVISVHKKKAEEGDRDEVGVGKR